MTRQSGARRPPLEWGRSSERGSVSIQMVVLMPLLFGIVLVAMQAALYYYAATVAGAAAQDGARVAAAYGSGGLGSGTAAASSALDQSRGALSNHQVTGSAGADGPTITVSGEPLSLLPGMAFTVTRSATLPWEELS